MVMSIGVRPCIHRSQRELTSIPKCSVARLAELVTLQPTEVTEVIAVP